VMFGGLGGSRLTFPVKHAVSSRRTTKERKLYILSKNLGRQVKRGFDASQHLVMHLELTVGILSASQTNLVVRARIQVIKDHLRTTRRQKCETPPPSNSYKAFRTFSDPYLVGARLANQAKIGNVDGPFEGRLVGGIKDRRQRNVLEHLVQA
jgi:hypothetical protein